MGVSYDKHIPIVVPSARIAEQAQELGYKDIEVAQNALPESMLDAVLRIREG
jgi:uroporphyrinogen-III synthase